MFSLSPADSSWISAPLSRNAATCDDRWWGAEQKFRPAGSGRPECSLSRPRPVQPPVLEAVSGFVGGEEPPVTC